MVVGLLLVLVLQVHVVTTTGKKKELILHEVKREKSKTKKKIQKK
jgi:hypothetical protein